MSKHYDIVINGAGIPGLTLALLLGRHGVPDRPRILLLDRHPLVANDTLHETPRSVDDFDLRVFALTEASRGLLEAAGAWPREITQRIYPYEQMHVWDAGGSGQIHFDAADLGTASLGYIAEGRVLQDWLIRQVLQENAIEMISGDEIDIYQEHQSGFQLTLISGMKIDTSLLVGADGANSRVRQLSGIDTVGWSYRQQAVVATVETVEDHQCTAWQRFLPEGPLAFLPMKKPWSSIVWSVSEQRADDLCELEENEFLQVLAGDFQHRLGEVKVVGQRAKFPLRMSHAQSYIAPGVALIADAAHTVHPLAGQGLNLGMQDVSALAEQIQLARSRGQNIGSRRVLRAYERARKGDNWLMQSSFDGLKRLFSNEQNFLTQLRNMGLNTIDRLPAVKNAFVRKAMGL